MDSKCWIHDKTETYRLRPYIVCFECGHIYKTRWHLAWVAAVTMLRFHNGYLRRNWKWVMFPSRISFCQECIHDF